MESVVKSANNLHICDYLAKIERLQLKCTLLCLKTPIGYMLCRKRWPIQPEWSIISMHLKLHYLSTKNTKRLLFKISIILGFFFPQSIQNHNIFIAGSVLLVRFTVGECIVSLVDIKYKLSITRTTTIVPLNWWHFHSFSKQNSLVGEKRKKMSKCAWMRPSSIGNQNKACECLIPYRCNNLFVL